MGIGLSRSAIWSDSAAGLAALLGFLGVLSVEAILLITAQVEHRASRPLAPVGARPADGVIEVLSMMGVVRTPGVATDPWQQFAGIERVDAEVPPTQRVFHWGRGVNPPLLGEVALISVFVGRDGRSWSDREIVDAYQSLRSAGRWIEQQAARFGAPLNLGLADTFFRVSDDYDSLVEVAFDSQNGDVGPMEAEATVKSMAAVSRVAGKLGFADVVDLMAEINPRVAADAHAWVIHFKQRGRSHAIPAGDRVVPGVGLALCYAREASFPEPLTGPGRVDPTTVVHELLHLFGASDKYGIPLRDFPNRSVSHRDIMRLDEVRLDRLVMGRLTAHEVGWSVDRVEDGPASKTRNPRLGQSRIAGD